MSDFAVPGSASRLDKVLHDLLRRAPELQAAAVVSFDGLPMASALPYGFDEDRVAAMSAALLSLGERASQGLGRGSLNQVYIEGEDGTVFLVSADDEAVLVAVGAHGAKVGLLLFEVRRGAQAVAETLRQEDPPEVAGYVGHDVSPLPVHVAGHEPEPQPEAAYVAPVPVPCRSPWRRPRGGGPRGLPGACRARTVLLEPARRAGVPDLRRSRARRRLRRGGAGAGRRAAPRSTRTSPRNPPTRLPPASRLHLHRRATSAAGPASRPEGRCPRPTGRAWIPGSDRPPIPHHY